MAKLHQHIKLLQDQKLPTSIGISNDINLDLNGNTLVGATGKDTIIVTGGNCNIVDTSVEKDGKIQGGVGSDHANGAGGNGGNAILVIDGSLTIAEEVTLVGGNGGSGLGAGGRPGQAIVVVGGTVINNATIIDGKVGTAHYSPDEDDDVSVIVPEKEKPEALEDESLQSSKPKKPNILEDTLDSMLFEDAEKPETIDLYGTMYNYTEVENQIKDIKVEKGSYLDILGLTPTAALELIVFNKQNREDAVSTLVKDQIININVVSIALTQKEEGNDTSVTKIEGRFQDKNQVIRSVLTPEDYIKALAGKKLELRLVITPLEGVQHQERLLLEKQDNQNVGQFIDISLFKIIDDADFTKISEMNDVITFSLDIPDKIRKEERKFTLILTHEQEDGTVEIITLEDEDKIMETITCSN